MKRFFAAALVGLVFVLPTASRADTATWTPSAATPFANGPQAGDSSNYVQRDGTTGDLTLLRVASGTPTGNLGCAAAAGTVYFQVTHVVTSAVSKVTVKASKILMDNFTWIKVTASIVGQEGALATEEVRGPVSNPSQTIVVTPVTPQGRRAQPGETMRIIFGMETVSACPNVDGGRATFDSVSIA